MDFKIRGIFEDYRRGLLDRREFLRRLAVLMGGTAAASALLPRLEAEGKAAQLIPENDSRLETDTIVYPAESGEMRAYRARPRGDGRQPGVIVIHENRGLVPHIKDVARRVALEGYVAVAPDALSPLGGTPGNPDEARPLFQKLDRRTNMKNFVAAVAYLKTNPQTTGKVACMGFCWGGGVTNHVAVNAPHLDAAVPFYGSQPPAEDVPKIKAAMLIHYAGDDPRINAGIPDFKKALEKANVEHEIHIYEGTKHAFFNDTGQRYNKEAAELAWRRTVLFLRKKLKA
ncbi:MAG: dienelactone hydrolase family protein [Candidatus Aminicenantes bacterium]|nr:dienelactone hydrolase family protein [Candidatus Aminicenantes bacterium]